MCMQSNYSRPSHIFPVCSFGACFNFHIMAKAPLYLKECFQWESQSHSNPNRRAVEIAQLVKSSPHKHEELRWDPPNIKINHLCASVTPREEWGRGWRQEDSWSSLVSQLTCIDEIQILWGTMSQKIKVGAEGCRDFSQMLKSTYYSYKGAWFGSQNPQSVFAIPVLGYPEPSSIVYMQCS